MNRFLTNLRNRLRIEHVDHLMRIFSIEEVKEEIIT